MEGYKELEDNCKISQFNASMSVSENNNLKLTFSEPTEYKLNTKDFKVNIPGIKFEYSLAVESKQVYKFIIDYQDSIDDDVKAEVTIANVTLRSLTGSFLSNYNFSGKLNKFELIPEEIQKTNTIIKGGKAIILAASIAIAIVSNPAAGWAMLNTIQLITYMPINSNHFPLAVKKFCGALGGFSFIPNLSSYLFNEDSADPPYKEARDYGITTSVFWINIGPSATIFIGMLALWPLFWIITKFNLGKISEKLMKILSNYRYSVFLRFLAQAYLDIGLFSLIQMKSVSFI